MSVARSSFRTTDPAVALAALEEAFPGARVRLDGVDPDFSYAQAARAGENVTTVGQHFHAQVQTRAENEHRLDYASVAWAHTGHVRFSTDRDAADADGAVLWAGEGPFTSDLDHARLQVTMVPLALLFARADAILGRPLALPSMLVTAPATPHTRALRRLVETMLDRALDPNLGDAPLVTAASTDVIVSSVLALFGLDEPAAARPVAPRVIQRAVAFVEAHATTPITVADIAAATHVSVRSLQLQFARHLDTTPGRYLRDRRLDAPRGELLGADPSVATVASISQSHGFAHRGRFAQAYLQRFGESPNETLRR